jgi:hypothetical protein
MNPQRTRGSTKARIKKNMMDLEMKHKNCSSSNSLKDFSPKIWNGRGKRCVRESGRCFSGSKWRSSRAHVWRREVGVSIYRWGSKTSRFLLFCTKTGWTGPKTSWIGFQKGLTQQTGKIKWTVQKSAEPVSTRLKTGWVSAWTSIWIPAEPAWKPAEPVFSREQFWPR